MDIKNKITTILSLLVILLLIGCQVEQTTPIQNETIEEPIDEDFIQNEIIEEAEIIDISGTEIELEDGVKLEFNDDVESLFEENNRVREVIENITETGNTTITNFSISDLVIEYDDRFRIIKNTSFVIENPRDFDLIFPDNDLVPGKFVEIQKPGPLTEVDTPEFLDDNIANFLSDCDKTDIICQKTPQELRDAIENKEGEFEIIETIDINKVPIPFDGLTLDLGNSNLRKDPVDVNLADIGFVESEDGNLTLMPLEQQLQYVGPAYYNHMFINGFTYGLDYSYSKSKSWKYFRKTIASVRVYADVGYGFGIRIPIEVDGTISKSVAFSNEPDYKAKLKVDTVDLDEAGYRKAGMPNMWLFDGNELVLKFAAVAGGKVRLFGTTILDEYKGVEFDNNMNFKPPIGGERLNLGDIEFKGHDLGLYYGGDNYYVTANLAVGFDLMGNKIVIDCENVNSLYCPEKLTFTSSGEQILDLEAYPTTFAKEDSNGKYDEFGIKLSNVKYHPRAIFDTKIALEGGVNTGDVFGWVKVTTPYISIYSLGLDLPSLGSHPATYTRMSLDDNKVYLRNTVHNFTLIEMVPNLTFETSNLFEPVMVLPEVDAEYDFEMVSPDMVIVDTTPSYEIESPVVPITTVNTTIITPVIQEPIQQIPQTVPVQPIQQI